MEESIKTLVDRVTDADIAKFTPATAPAFRGEVRVLMPLTAELIRYYVAVQMAQRRSLECVLRTIQLLAQAMRPVAEKLFDQIASDNFLTDPASQSISKFFGDAQTEVSSVLSGISPIEPDPMDELIQERFKKDLVTALNAHFEANPDAEPSAGLRFIQHGIYLHDGQWVVAMEKCLCPACMLSGHFSPFASESRTPTEADIAEILKQRPDGVRVTDAAALDLSDCDDEDRREKLRDRIKRDLEVGTIVIDMGLGKEPRFEACSVHTASFEVLGGLDMAEFLSLFGDDQEEPEAPRNRPKRKPAFMGWFGKGGTA
jgi:hypothetical protein